MADKKKFDVEVDLAVRQNSKEDCMANEKGSRPTRKISLVYTNADVKMVRPNLTAAQCGEVLDYVLDHFNYTVGVTWERLAVVAESLFPLEEPTQTFVEDFVIENGHDGVAADLLGYDLRQIDGEWKKFVRRQP